MRRRNRARRIRSPNARICFATEGKACWNVRDIMADIIDNSILFVNSIGQISQNQAARAPTAWSRVTLTTVTVQGASATTWADTLPR